MKTCMLPYLKATIHGATFVARLVVRNLRQKLLATKKVSPCMVALRIVIEKVSSLVNEDKCHA